MLLVLYTVKDGEVYFPTNHLKNYSTNDAWSCTVLFHGVLSFEQGRRFLLLVPSSIEPADCYRLHPRVVRRNRSASNVHVSTSDIRVRLFSHHEEPYEYE